MQPAGQEITDSISDGPALTVETTTETIAVKPKRKRPPKLVLSDKDLPTVPVDAIDGQVSQFEDKEAAISAARTLGMTVFSSPRRKALAVIGTEMSRAGIVKVGRGLYMMTADRAEDIIAMIKRELRGLDEIRKKSDGKVDDERSEALRMEFLQLYREVVAESRDIAKNMVASDKADHIGADGPAGGTPSFRPGAQITAVKTQQVVNVTINKESPH